MSDVARITWAGGRLLIGTDGAGHSLVMDAKSEHGGQGAGVRPVELVLQGLAGCTAMDVISILEKKRQDVRALEIHVTGTQREDAYPKIYTDIEVVYTVTGFGVKPEAVARAIELSEEKYCSVKGMLGPEVHVSFTYEVIDAREAGRAALSGDPVSE